MPATSTSKVEVHRALSSTTRIRVLDVVVGSVDGIDAGEVARRLDYHVNTVRAHLGVLERAGLVRSHLEERRRRGRPRRMYRATATEDLDTSPLDGRESDVGYRQLAALLADGISETGTDGAQRVVEASARWGEQLIGDLVEGSEPSDDAGPNWAPRPIVALLADLGFSPQVERNGSITLRSCPFMELARDHEQVVCSAHRGILSGALAGLGRDPGIQLDPFVTPDTCRVRLAGPGISGAA